MTSELDIIAMYLQTKKCPEWLMTLEAGERHGLDFLLVPPGSVAPLVPCFQTSTSSAAVRKHISVV